MSAVPFVHAALLADEAVSGLVGGEAGLHYSVAPPDAGLPHVILVGTGGEEPEMLGGVSGWPEGYVEAVVVGSAFHDAERLGNAVLSALRDRDGQWNGQRFQVWREPVDSFDYAPDPPRHRRVLSFRVRYAHG